MMAYGCVGDVVDEYLSMGERTVKLCLEKKLYKKAYTEQSLKTTRHWRDGWIYGHDWKY